MHPLCLSTYCWYRPGLCFPFAALYGLRNCFSSVLQQMLILPHMPLSMTIDARATRGASVCVSCHYTGVAKDEAIC